MVVFQAWMLLASFAMPMQQSVIVIAPPVLNEAIRSSAQTAGEDVVGLTSTNPRATLSSRLLTVSGMQSDHRFVCVYLERASGLYAAKFTSRIPAGQRTVTFQLNSANLLRLGLRLGELAVRAQSSSTASCPRTAPLLPVNWGSTTARSFALLVNSQNAGHLTAKFADGISLSCNPIPQTIGVPNLVPRSFDTICQSAGQIPCGQEREITISRRTGMNYWPRVHAIVAGQCG
ncbi:MAG: hypothetical protein EOP50_04615 [Sphingobacteriales bacterium]|nr:MAG: hypothetical protein EOP50_04615 [Sphingobacteriales bacterium]